mgnify:CR=1 FL=1
MARKKCKNSCKGIADQYLTLVTIYAAIINQQFDDADELEVFADFLIGEIINLTGIYLFSDVTKYISPTSGTFLPSDILLFIFL